LTISVYRDRLEIESGEESPMPDLEPIREELEAIAGKVHTLHSSVIELLDGSGKVIASAEGYEAKKKLLKIAKIVGPA
jgi:hypothetical protein